MKVGRSSAERAMVYGHGWLALGAAAQTWWTCMYLGHGLPHVRITLAVFFGMFAMYNLLRWVRSREEVTRQVSPLLHWHHVHRGVLLPVSMVAVVAGLLLLAPELGRLWRVVALALLPGLLYLLPWQRGGRSIGLRHVPMLKVLVITWCWTMATVALPIALGSSDLFAEPLLAHGMVHVPLYLAVALLFDLRDRHVDPPGLRTVPQLIGEGWTRALVVLLFLYAGAIVLLRGMLGYMAYVEGDIPWSEVLASMGFLLGAVLALFASTKRSDRFFDLGVDGLLILIPMLAWSGERI
jgi:hypothetical protein